MLKVNDIPEQVIRDIAGAYHRRIESTGTEAQDEKERDFQRACHLRTALEWMALWLNQQAAPAAQAAGQHADDFAVDRFAEAMKAKMAASRAKGRGGWERTEVCPPGSLQRMLLEHIAKGDPVDVGNFAMMIFNRGESTAAAQPAAVLEEPTLGDAPSYYSTNERHKWLAGWRSCAALLAAPVSPAAQSVAEDVVRDAERYRFLRALQVGVNFDWNGERIAVLEFEMPRGFAIGSDCDKNIDSAMLAAQQQKEGK